MASSLRGNRRQFLTVAAGTASLGLTGCLGFLEEGGEGLEFSTDPGSEEDPYELRVATSDGGTWDTGLAVEQTFSQHSDIIDYSTIQGPGNVSNIYRMAEGQFPAAYVDRNALTQAQNGEGQFEEEPVDHLPWQGPHAFLYSIFIVAREGLGIETFDDLAGTAFYPAEPGYSTRETTLAIFEMTDETSEVYNEMEIMDMDVDDAPGAFEEERIDAAIAYGTPGVGMTGYVAEYDARINVEYVEPTDALIEAVDLYPGSGSIYTDPDEFMMENTPEPDDDEVFGWTFDVTMPIHSETPDEVAYEIGRMFDEHSDDVRDAEPRFFDHEDTESTAQAMIDDYPVHPGWAEYLQDNDAWNDDWVIGEEDDDYFND